MADQERRQIPGQGWQTVAVGEAGPGLPDEWTVGDGGQLLIAPTTAGGDALAVRAAAGGSVVFRLQNNTQGDLLTVETDGDVTINGLMT